MDTTVTQIGAVVVARLHAAGYMESTVGQYQKTIKALTKFVEERGDVYTPELGAEFASMTRSPRTGRVSAQRRLDYGRLVGVFDSYVRTGRVDLSVRRRGGGGRRPGSGEFTALDTAWEADMAQRGLASATRAAYGRVARGYLVFLEDRGIYSLDVADAASVIEFLQSSAGQVGEVLPALGGVELPSVLGVHRPYRFGRRGEPGRCQTLPHDSSRYQR